MIIEIIKNRFRSIMVEMIMIIMMIMVVVVIILLIIENIEIGF